MPLKSPTVFEAFNWGYAAMSRAAERNRARRFERTVRNDQRARAELDAMMDRHAQIADAYDAATMVITSCVLFDDRAKRCPVEYGT